MSGLHFETHVDFAKLDRDIEALNTKLTDLLGDVKRSGEEVNGIFSRIGPAIGAYFSYQALSGFTSELVRVRGEFQQLEVAFNTMLGSKAKADTLMAQVVDLASTTPFSLQEVAGGAKQLLAVQEPAEQVVDTLRRIGDVSAGLSVPIGQLIKAYGDVKAKGRLMGQEMLQFMGAGVPMTAELAKHFNVAESEISKMVETGKVGFTDVQQVIKNLTSEGGMFANLMEKQSKTLTGLVSNLGDAWDQMLNDIGKESEGFLAGGIKAAISLVENYEKIVDALKVIIATYGVYRAVVVMNTIAIKGYSDALGLAVIRQKALALAQKATPGGIALTAFTALAGGLYMYSKSLKGAETATTSINKSIMEETTRLTYLFDQLKKTGEGTEERKRLIEEVNQKYGTYLDNLLTEGSALEEIERAQRRATKALMADIAVKESRKKIEEELSDYTEQLQSKFKEFSSVVSKMSPAVHAEFLSELNDAIERQASISGDKLKTGLLQYSTIAKELYDKYVSSISAKSGYLKYDFASFQEAFFDVASVRIEKNKTINELNGYVDAYQQIFENISKPIEGNPAVETLRRDVAYWELQKKEAQQSLDKLTKEDSSFITSQAKYLGMIEEAEREIAVIRGKKDKEKVQTLNDSINEQVEAWERYYQYLEFGYQDLAQKQSEALKGSALTLKGYLLEMEEDLLNRLSKANPDSKEFKEAAEALGNVKAKRVELDGGKSALDQFKEAIEQQRSIFQDHEEWKLKFGKEKAAERFGDELKGFDSYLNYLYAEMEKFQNRSDTTGISQKAFLGGEISKTEAGNRKTTAGEIAAVLEATMTFNQRRLQLEEDYQRKRHILTTMGAADNIEVLDKTYKDELAALESKHIKESESYQWVYESFDRMGRQALRNYIEKLREEIKAKAWSDEVKLMLSEKLAQAEEKLADQVPERLNDVAGVLRDAAGLAGEFDEGLAKAINTAADLATAVSSIATGLANGNPFQVIGGLLQGLTTLVNASSRNSNRQTEQLEESLGRVNKQLERYAQLINGLSGLEKLKAYSEQLNRVKEQLVGINEQMQQQMFSPDKGKKWGDRMNRILNTAGQMGIGTDTSQWSEENWIAMINVTSGEQRKRLEALYDQWQQLKESQAEYFMAQAEYATGTSFDSLLDGMLNALTSGERTVADFADNVEELLRNAIIQGFKTKYLVDALEPWYQQFGAMAADGLSAKEIESLRASLQAIMGNAATAFEALGDLGVDFDGMQESAEGLSGAIKGMSQESADLMAGQLGAMRIHLADIAAVVTGRLNGDLEAVFQDSAMTVGLSTMGNSMNQMRDAIVQSNAYLYQIEANTRQLREIKEILRGNPNSNYYTNGFLDDRINGR